MRLVGLDIAGWNDVGARDWDIDIPEQNLDAPIIMNGGVGSVAILQDDGSWVGGPQAALAPHGLGAGWGSIGALERRVRVASLYKDLVKRNGRPDQAYSAAIDALSRHAEQLVINVPDVSTFDEAARARVLSVAGSRRGTTRLLWRPVAMFLHALQEGLISRDRIGQSFGFLVHSEDGFEFQVLRLREDHENPGHLAPEREGYGVVLCRSHGLAALSAAINEQVVAANPILLEEGIGRVALDVNLLCGSMACGSTHLARHNNGSWVKLKAPETLIPTDFDTLVDELARELEDRPPISATFVASPISIEQRRTMLDRLAARQEATVYLPWRALAVGALKAGRLIEKGLPHYFDRLTPVSLAVYRNEAPIFHSLVDGRATLPANREYVAPPYEDLEWSGGQRDLEFYILKDAAEVRHWSVHIDDPPERNVQIELRFRQHPGQTWAKLSLTSPVWETLQKNPIFLDWESLPPVDLTPDQVLERLRVPPPTIPERIVEPSHIDFWRGSDRLAALLPKVKDGHPADLAKLLPRAMRFPGMADQSRAISTDGMVPNALTAAEVGLFDRRIAGLAKELISAVGDNVELTTNDALRVLTWSFTRCPQKVQELIVEALEMDLEGQKHPLLSPLRARTVLVQGGGRSISEAQLMRRFVNVLMQQKKPNNDTFSALSMLLSRRQEAPQALDQELVARIAAMIASELSRVASAGRANALQIRFKNALSALAGLFRFREVEPYALLRDKDPAADRICQDLDRIRKQIGKNRSQITNADVKINLVQKVAEFLEGRGQRNILTQIDRFAETNPDEDE